MSSISAMGPHFFHWKNKLWVRGGRSRLALSENIENYFFGAVNDRLIPSKPANLRDPYKIRFSIFFEKSKNVAIIKMTNLQRLKLANKIGSLIIHVYNDAKCLTLSAFSWPSRVVTTRLAQV